MIIPFETICSHLGVPINRGIQNLLVYHGKHHLEMDDLGLSRFQETIKSSKKIHEKPIYETITRFEPIFIAISKWSTRPVNGSGSGLPWVVLLARRQRWNWAGPRPWSSHLQTGVGISIILRFTIHIIHMLLHGINKS